MKISKMPVELSTKTAGLAEEVQFYQRLIDQLNWEWACEGNPGKRTLIETGIRSIESILAPVQKEYDRLMKVEHIRQWLKLATTSGHVIGG